MQNLEDIEIWLDKLSDDDNQMSNEQIVQGFLKFYALHGLSLDDVKHSLKDRESRPEYCEAAMQNLRLAMEHFADREESRTLPEVQMIVDAVREGIPIHVEYYDPDIDDDPYVTRGCW